MADKLWIDESLILFTINDFLRRSRKIIKTKNFHFLQQTHKMDYMLFASIVKSIFFEKIAIISSLNDENQITILTYA